MLRRSADLLAVIALANVAGALALLPPAFAPVRAPFALLLVLFLPGYALTAALFPGRGPGRAERLLFSVGLSLAITALGSVALDRTVWGLQAGSWLALLLGTTLLAGLAALARRAWLAAPPGKPVPLGLGWGQGLTLGLAVVGAAAALTLAAVPAPPQGGLGYTQLWALPAADGDPNVIRVGLSSSEFDSTQYRLEVTLDGQSLREWPELTLAPGETWEGIAELPPGGPGAGLVEAKLYRLADPGAVYRRVTLWREARQPTVDG